MKIHPRLSSLPIAWLAFADFHSPTAHAAAILFVGGPAAPSPTKQAVGLSTDRPHVLRQAIMACRKAGTVSVPGEYVGLLDKIPFGAAMNKGLTIKTGQTHVQRYLVTLLGKIEEIKIDSSFVVTHRIGLEEAPAAYEKFRTKSDGCIKVVIKPGLVLHESRLSGAGAEVVPAEKGEPTK